MFGCTTSASKFAIWKDAVAADPGNPGVGVFVAEKLRVAGGQNQSGWSVQAGTFDGGEKKRPFDPVSTKDPCSGDPPASVVVKSPEPSSAIAVAGPGMLFERVPIPRTTAPSTAGAPSPGTPGKTTIRPLLSTGRAATGFWTCADVGTATPTVVLPSEEKKVPFAVTDAQVGPVSAPVHDDGTVPNVASITWIGTGTAGSFARMISAVCTGPQSASTCRARTTAR